MALYAPSGSVPKGKWSVTFLATGVLMLIVSAPARSPQPPAPSLPAARVGAFSRPRSPIPTPTASAR